MKKKLALVWAWCTFHLENMPTAACRQLTAAFRQLNGCWSMPSVDKFNSGHLHAKSAKYNNNLKYDDFNINQTELFNSIFNVIKWSIKMHDEVTELKGFNDINSKKL